MKRKCEELEQLMKEQKDQAAYEANASRTASRDEISQLKEQLAAAMQKEAPALVIKEEPRVSLVRTEEVV